jgi:AraC-like DNA-binding protein
MRGGFVGWDLNSRWFAERAVLLNVACLFAPQVKVEIPAPPRAHCEPIHYEQGDPLVQGFYREILLRHAEDLSLADVAKHLHVSTRKLQRMLQSQGVSFVGYLHDVRMKMAGVLMLRDDSPLAEVARAVGIPDPSYFSKVFLKHYGVSPTGYRRFLKEHV